MKKNQSKKEKYNICNVVAFGSPLVSPIGREGSIRRLGDIRDVVPYMSLSGTILLPWQITGLNKEDGGYSNCIYFSLNKISSVSVATKNVIDNGTAGGGAIEIYKTVEDAMARCEYLSDYDNNLILEIENSCDLLSRRWLVFDT
mgnify:CR=1 FL=1